MLSITKGMMYGRREVKIVNLYMYDVSKRRSIRLSVPTS